MRIVAPLIALFFVACSASSPKSGFQEKADSGPGFGTGNGSSGTIGGNTPPGPGGNQAGCSDAAKLVYVVSDSNELFSFAPDKVAFTKIGQLNCPSGGATPNSMAVDRSGNAWVNFSDGGLFKVSTADAS